jgi:hypothetical protein
MQDQFNRTHLQVAHVFDRFGRFTFSRLRLCWRHLYSLLRIELTVVDCEAVDVPIGTFKNCRNIKIEEIWPWTEDIG